jgi:hypothetical protein
VAVIVAAPVILAVHVHGNATVGVIERPKGHAIPPIKSNDRSLPVPTAADRPGPLAEHRGMSGPDDTATTTTTTTGLARITGLTARLRAWPPGCAPR